MTEKEYRIDRFEGEYAVLLDSSGQTYQIGKNDLPSSCKEGDILIKRGSLWVADDALSQKHRSEVAERLANLFSNRKGK